MSGVGFVFCGASKALLAALEWHERLDPSKLLDGTESYGEQVARRWACPAVQLKVGAGRLVVPKTASVWERRVRASDSDRFSGRRQVLQPEWLKANAVAGALGVCAGAGR